MFKSFCFCSLLLLSFISFCFGKVYDCFLFFNEYEVLDIRLHEMYDVVDHFVIVESCETHAGIPKPFRFEESRERYAQFLDKVIYVKLHERQHGNDIDALDREIWQRNQIMRGLVHCNPNDMIIVSDCDEIISSAVMPEIIASLDHHTVVGCSQTLYGYFLNRSQEGHPLFDWPGSACIKYKDLERISPEEARDIVNHNGTVATNNLVDKWVKGGWHFTFMGGIKSTIEKRNNYSHSRELTSPYNPSYEEWKSFVNKTFRLVEIDESYPQYVRDNVQHFISQGLIDTNVSY